MYRAVSVVETVGFLAKAKGCMTDAERAAAVDMVAHAPECGDLIEGGGGIRKVRFAIGGRGKSGGVRIIYYYHNQDVPLFMLAVFAKNEKSNLTKAERNALAVAAKAIAGAYGEMTAMGSKAFDEIMAGLDDALAYAQGDRSRGRETVVELPAVDVQAARQRLGLSQPEFAEAFGVSVATVRNWEQRRRAPKGAARVLLTVIERNPAAVVDALREGRAQRDGTAAAS